MEYALMIALLAVVIASAVTALGQSAADQYDEVGTTISSSGQTAPGNQGNGGNSGNTNGWGMGSGGGQNHN